jgi:hypothetical protein
VSEKRIFDRIIKIAKYNDLSKIDVERIQKFMNNNKVKIDLDGKLLEILSNNPYAFYQQITDLIVSYFNNITNSQVKLDYLGVNNESCNASYSDGLIIVDDNFSRMLIGVSILTIHIIYGELGELKYKLIDELENSIFKVVVLEEDYFAEDLLECEWLDPNLLQTASSLYWAMMYFILGHEIAHSILEKEYLSIDREEILADKYSYKMIVEIIFGDYFKENISLHKLLLYAPAIFFTLTDFIEGQYVEVPKTNIHESSVERARICCEYMKEYDDGIGGDCYQAHQALFEYMSGNIK